MPMLETLLLLTVYAAVPAAILLFLVRHKIDGAMQSVGAFILFVSVCTVITAHDPANVWLLGLGAIVSLVLSTYGYSEFGKFWRLTKEDQTHLQQERDHVKIDRNHLQEEHDYLLGERGQLQDDRNFLRTERQHLQKERNHLEAERDTLEIDRDRLNQDIDQATLELQAKSDQLDFTLKELTHRSRNLLTIVLAIMRKVSTEEEYDSLSPRIRALAVTHDVLIERNWRGGYLPDIVKAQNDNFGYPIQVAPTKAPKVLLNPTAMQMFGLAIHELASNNIRHNGGSQPRLHWRVVNDRLKVMWYERLVNPDQAGAEKFGFGHYVLNTIMPQHFGGSSRFITTRNARAWFLDVPLQTTKFDEGPQGKDSLRFVA